MEVMRRRGKEAADTFLKGLRGKEGKKGGAQLVEQGEEGGNVALLQAFFDLFPHPFLVSILWLFSLLLKALAWVQNKKNRKGSRRRREVEGTDNGHTRIEGKRVDQFHTKVMGGYGLHFLFLLEEIINDMAVSDFP